LIRKSFNAAVSLFEAFSNAQRGFLKVKGAAGFVIVDHGRRRAGSQSEQRKTN
jgi:hypothetical protein